MVDNARTMLDAALALPQLGSLPILVPLADLHPRTRPTDEPPFSGSFLNLPPAMIFWYQDRAFYCRPKYYFRTVTGPCSGCHRFLMSLNRLRINSRVSWILGGGWAWWGLTSRSLRSSPSR
jgi:hypothetical protein